jgi:hypothetical protein
MLDVRCCSFLRQLVDVQVLVLIKTNNGPMFCMVLLYGVPWMFCWSGWIRGRILFKGGRVWYPKFSEKKLNLIFSFLWYSVALGFAVLGGIPQKTVDLLAFFSLGSGAQRGERVWGIDLDPVDGSPPLLPNPSRPPLRLPNWVAVAPLPLLLSSPMAATPYPLHVSLLPLDPPHAARIEKRTSTLNWRGREDQGDVLPHLFLKICLGKTLGMDEILIPPCNYVLLEVVDHGD